MHHASASSPFLLVLALVSSGVNMRAVAQEVHSEQTDSIRPGRAWAVAGGTAVFATGSLIALDQTWYVGYERTAFHGFDDGNEWFQVDKLGHANSTYQLGRAGNAAFRWAGFNKRTSTWLGGSVGLLYLTGVEYLDGHSSAWGFSGWDMLANGAGTGLFIGQQLGWNEQRILLKWSAQPTDFAAQRPDVLGSTIPERLLKDYNGSTVWLSGNPNSFGWKGMPTWLNFAVGLGADGMLHADGDPGAYRQWYLAPDIAFSRIPTKSKFLRTAFFLLDALKMPAPTLELHGNGGLRGHWLYF
ncbi:MAG: DUF2279 domain-containing protein [Flavobacteriales bacterium]|nr:DUF2279 domain-containing protein [Flavobacteriales bacterium]